MIIHSSRWRRSRAARTLPMRSTPSWVWRRGNQCCRLQSTIISRQVLQPILFAFYNCYNWLIIYYTSDRCRLPVRPLPRADRLIGPQNHLLPRRGGLRAEPGKGIGMVLEWREPWETGNYMKWKKAQNSNILTLTLRKGLKKRRRERKPKFSDLY